MSTAREIVQTAHGFYPLFMPNEQVVLRNPALRFQGQELPDVVYTIVKHAVAMGSVVRSMCGVGPCDVVCEVCSVVPTTPARLPTRSLYVQQNLVGYGCIAHFRMRRNARYPQGTMIFHVGTRARRAHGPSATVVELNKKSVRVITDDGQFETWRLRSIVEVA